MPSGMEHQGVAMDPKDTVVVFGWLPQGTTQNDLDDGDFAWLSDAYKAGKESKSAGRKLPFKIHGKVNADGWKAAWSRAHQDGTDFSGGPSQADVIAKLKAAKPAGVTVQMSEEPDDIERGKSAIRQAFDALLDKVTPTKEPMSEPVSFTADFSTATPAGDMVIRTGKLFEIGDYPDKGFTFTADDMARAVENFTPVPLDAGDAHIPTPLEGLIGNVQRIFPGEDGTSLMGEISMPRWLDEGLDQSRRRVSTEWDRATKRLSRLSLVWNPRVSDAALMTAFSAHRDSAGKFARHNTPSGQETMQAGHDLMASRGAVCSPVGMASQHEASAVQQAHDLFASHGAQCESIAQTGGSIPAMYADNLSPIRRATMSTLRDWLTGRAKADGVELDPADLDAAFSTDPPPILAELQAKLDEEKAANETLRKQQEAHTATFARLESERRHAEAVTFAQAQVQAKRVTPAAAELLVPLAERIAAADSTVTFAEGEVPTSKLLADFIAAQPDFSLFTTEHIKREEVAALFSQTVTDDGTEKPPTDERIKELMKLYPEGRNGAATKA